MKNAKHITVYAITIILSLILVQLFYLKLQSMNLEKLKTIFTTVTKYEKITQNPYTLSETLQTLEKSNIIKCTTLKLEASPEIFFNSVNEDSCHTSKIFLNGEKYKFKLNSINGLQWSIETISINPESFGYNLNITRLLVIVIATFIFFVLRLRFLNDSLKIELMQKEKLIYQQVSHDIQSPLFVLKNQLFESGLDSQNREISRAAYQRLESILNDTRLRDNYDVTEQRSFDLKEAISEIILEKELINKKRNFINLIIEKDLKINVQSSRTEIQRVFSNLLNNSIEASSNTENFKINIIVEIQGKNVIIKIIDQGSGFPNDVLLKVGKEKVSVGKESLQESGSGLGLFHAFTTLNKLGHKISVSNLSLGAQVLIQISNAQISKCDDKFDYVYVEDDQMLCFLWSEKAKKENIKLKILNHPSFFNEVLDKINYETKIFCDSNFKDAKGEDLLENLYTKGFRNLFLTTGYDANKFKNQDKFKVISKTIPF